VEPIVQHQTIKTSIVKEAVGSPPQHKQSLTKLLSLYDILHRGCHREEASWPSNPKCSERPKWLLLGQLHLTTIDLSNSKINYSFQKSYKRIYCLQKQETIMETGRVEPQTSKIERGALCLAGAIAGFTVGRHAVGVACSTGSIPMPQRVAVIAGAGVAGLGTGIAAKLAMQPHEDYGVDQMTHAWAVGLAVGLPLWALAARYLNQVVPLPQMATARNFMIYNAKLLGATSVGAMPAAALGLVTGYGVAKVLGKDEYDRDSLPTYAAVGVGLITWGFATRSVKNWMTMPALGGSTWLGLLRHGGVLGLGFAAGWPLAYGAARVAGMTYHDRWDERELTGLDRAAFAFGGAATLWCLNHGLGMDVPPASNLTYLALLPITIGGARIGDLLNDRWVKYQTEKRGT
jgi:hypothetical protein